MQKIKNSIIDKMIAARLTSNEIDFLIYVSRFQDDNGRVAGIHYKEVCEEMNISYQGFYDVKKSLEEKGFISSEKSNRIDHDITILNNAFTGDETTEGGYVNTSHNIFYMKEFFALKAGAKLLAMHMMKVTFSNKGRFIIGVDTFYDEKTGYHKRFGVSKRVMRMYLMQLKTFFSIGIKDKKYYITPKKIVYRMAGQASEVDNYRNHNVEVICRRNRIKDAGAKEKRDINELMRMYRKDALAAHTDVIELVKKAVERSLEMLNINEERIVTRVLKPKLIHKIMRQELGLA